MEEASLLGSVWFELLKASLQSGLTPLNWIPSTRCPLEGTEGEVNVWSVP